MKDDQARAGLLRRLGLSFVWGDERLDSSRFAYLFDNRQFDDLEELGRYFWTVRCEPLTSEQKERILQFWDRCAAWAATLDSPPARLLSQLSLLSSYLTAIDDRALKQLIAVAPYAAADHNADRLIKDLGRLADTNPAATARILRVLLQRYEPTYDFEDRLKKLLEQLATHTEFSSRRYTLYGTSSPSSWNGRALRPTNVMSFPCQSYASVSIEEEAARQALRANGAPQSAPVIAARRSPRTFAPPVWQSARAAEAEAASGRGRGRGAWRVGRRISGAGADPSMAKLVHAGLPVAQ